MEIVGVTPVYGFGWYEKNGRSIDTPVPFILRIDQIHGQIGESGSRFSGLILGEFHEFAGKCAALEIRTIGPQPHYNVLIYEKSTQLPEMSFDEARIIATGFAHLS